MRDGHGLTVLKIGGSLARSRHLKDWLDAIAACAEPLVVVPGGGPFADQVRGLQDHWRFPDPLAHHLAILAMEIFGRMLAGLGANLVAVDSKAAIGRALAEGSTPVWLPARMAIGRPEIPESWAVTSDSLSAWLARHLRARRLVLIKSRCPKPSAARLEDLVRDGLIDPAFPDFFPGAPCQAWCLEASESRKLPALLTGAPEGTQILPNGSC